jgi:formiminoglutamase
MNIPHTKPAAWPEVTPGRFAVNVRRDSPKGCAVALLGLPDETGVRLNQGRPGAAQGPAAFRAALARYGAAESAAGPWPAIFDAGDVTPAGLLVHTHSRVTEAASALLEAGLFPVGIGGGHDLTFPLARAVAKRFSPLAGVYFDAHLDVRQSEGSGMAFRKLIEDSGVKELHLHGFRPLVNSREHYDWFLGHHGHAYEDDAPVILPQEPQNLFASFDLDVLDMAYAPGVSAPNPSGWCPALAERLVFACGADPRVRSFDLMELSPPQDEGGRTARLAAHLFLTFLHGFAQRS